MKLKTNQGGWTNIVKNRHGMKIYHCKATTARQITMSQAVASCLQTHMEGGQGRRGQDQGHITGEGQGHCPLRGVMFLRKLKVLFM